ncbi:MAG: DedA family protein [Rhodothermales bacterium]|nr:DedA family protein [Rhodothermales bacterium]
MEGLLTDIVTWMEGLRPAWVYATVFVVAYLENVVPPIPGDMVVVFGGYLVGLGHASFAPVVLLATVAGALGFMTMYAVGRRIGVAVLDPDRLRWIPKGPARKVQRWLHRWGYGVVGANRFLSGARSIISLMVGAARMPAWPVAFWSTLSAGVWCLLIAYAGYAVGERWEVVGEYLKEYGQWLTGLLIFAAALYGARIWWRRRRARAAR